MDKMRIKEKVEALQNQLGGKIFALPIDDENPFSKYCVAMFDGEKMNVFPDEMSVQEAAAGINLILESLKKEGLDSNYERLVRFISNDVQLNAPDVTMRRLKKSQGALTAGFQEGQDFSPGNGDEQLISSRGLIKMSYIMLIDDKNPTAKSFMDEYYKLLAMRKYGKTASAIKQEVRRMGRNEALKWVERTYAKYINSGTEVMDILNKIKNLS